MSFREIGGYIELDTYRLPMLHEKAIKLNCGRNALWYLLKARKIKKIWMPKFMCDSCNGVLKKQNVEVTYYSIGLDFKPKDICPATDEWLYVVNFYGQLSNNYLQSLKAEYPNLIVDNAQAYYQMPIAETDTIYTCRKFFGVPDGAILYTDALLEDMLPRDESFERMHFLLGRFERTASEFYGEYVKNNHFFADEPIKEMSKLTDNLLHAIDYEAVKQRRTENFTYLHQRLGKHNRLQVSVPEGAFMYPFYIENGAYIRKQLQTQKIFVPTLWPNVLALEGTLEKEYAENILPLPCDQRYSTEDMEYIVKKLLLIASCER